MQLRDVYKAPPRGSLAAFMAKCDCCPVSVVARPPSVGCSLPGDPAFGGQARGGSFVGGNFGDVLLRRYPPAAPPHFTEMGFRYMPMHICLADGLVIWFGARASVAQRGVSHLVHHCVTSRSVSLQSEIGMR